MIETNIPDIDVNQIMEEISKDVALIIKLPSFQQSAGTDNFPAPCPELNPFDASPDIQPQSLQNRYTLTEMLEFHDTEFITYAYRALLRRIPDQGGSQHYLSQLRTGGLTKAEIVGRLRFSEEGKRAGIPVKGLLLPFMVQSSFKIPVLGRILRIIIGIMNLPVILKNIQIIENRVFSPQQSVDVQVNVLHSQLNHLRDYIISSQEQMADQISQAASKKDIQAIDQQQRQLLDESTGRLLEIISKIDSQESDEEENHFDDQMSLAFLDKFRGSREEIKVKQAIYLPYVNQALEQSKADKILDIGSGRGEWLELLRDNGCKGSGVDMNRVLVEQCKKDGLDVHCVDGLTYLQAQPAQSYGVITGFHIVEHLSLQTLLLLFGECFRVLSPGGIAIFETPNPENLVTGACDFYLDPTHRKPLPPMTLHFLIEAGGGRDLQVIRCHPSDDLRVDDKTVDAYLSGPRDYSVLAWK